jgi:hypothetical protein
MLLRTALILTSLVLFAGCKSPPPRGPSLVGLRSHAARIDPSYLGTWKGPDARVYQISAASDDTMLLQVTQTAGETIALKGRILPIDGVRFIEIELPPPANVTPAPATDGEKAKPVPIFAYARFKPTLTTLEYSALSASWLQEEVRNSPDATYWSGESLASGTGGIAVRSPAFMFDLLRKAAATPAAFAPVEILTKVE